MPLTVTKNNRLRTLLALVPWVSIKAKQIRQNWVTFVVLYESQAEGHHESDASMEVLTVLAAEGRMRCWFTGKYTW